MPIAPTGNLNQPLLYAQAMIANCPSFIAWANDPVNSPSAAGAIEHAFLFALPAPAGETFAADELAVLRPGVVINPAPSEQNQTLVGSPHAFQNSGTIILRFEDETPGEARDGEALAQIWFRSLLGGVVDDLKALSDTGGYLNIKALRVGAIARSPMSSWGSEGDYMSGEIELDWWGL